MLDQGKNQGHVALVEAQFRARDDLDRALVNGLDALSDAHQVVDRPDDARARGREHLQLHLTFATTEMSSCLVCSGRGALIKAQCKCSTKVHAECLDAW